MQIQVTVSLDKNAAVILSAIAEGLKGGSLAPNPGEMLYQPDPESDCDAQPEPAKAKKPKAEAPKKGRGRPKKEPEPEIEDEIEDEEPEAEDDFDEPEDEENDEDETVTPDEQKKVRAALKAYSQKHSRDAAAAILLKFAKRSEQVKRVDVAKLLKALKV